MNLLEFGDTSQLVLLRIRHASCCPWERRGISEAHAKHIELAGLNLDTRWELNLPSEVIVAQAGLRSGRGGRMARQKDCKSFHVGSNPARASNSTNEVIFETVIRENKYSHCKCAFLL